jgi:RHS repeat-associated protein
MTLETADGKIAWWLEDSAANGTFEDDVAVYKDVQPGVDLQARAVSDGLKEDLVLRNPAGPTTFTYRLQMDPELVPELAAGGHAVAIRRAGNVRFVIPTMPMVDADQSRGPRPFYALENRGDGEWRLEVRLDSEWLRDGSRSWPVTVDPTVSSTTNVSATQGCAFWEFTPELGQGDHDWDFGFCNPSWSLEIGNGHPEGGRPNPGHFRGYLKFDLTSLGTEDIVSSAKLHLYRIYADGPSPLNIARMDVGTNDGAYEDAYNSVWHTSPGHWLNLLPPSPASSAVGSFAVDLTTTTAQWQARRSDPTAGKPNFGLLLSSSEKGWGTNLDDTPNPPCASTPCESQMTYIGSPGDSTVARRPYLEIVSWPKAPAGSRITSPVEGQLTSRRVELEVSSANSTVTSARFQYVMGDERDWQDVPASALRYVDPQSGNTEVAGLEVPMQSNRSTPVIWDIQKTAGGQLDGNVHIRAILNDSTGIGAGVTSTTNIVLNRINSESVATEQIGPGTVNLLSGDLALEFADAHIDAAISDLDLKRTYHSRGTQPRDVDMFGPGWTSGVEVAQGEMKYKALTSYSEIQEQYVTNWVGHETLNQIAIPTDVGCVCISIWNWEYYPVVETLRWEYQYTTVELLDGGKINFAQRVDPSGQPSGWDPDADHPGMKLEKSASDWVLTDTKGNTTTFAQQADGAANYVPSAFTEVGATASLLYAYDLVGGVKRLARVTAPAISETVSNPEREARYLRFVWSDVPTPDGPKPRVTSVRFGRWDPDMGAVAEIEVAGYLYDAAGRLQSASDPRVSGGLAESYAYDSAGRMSSYTPPGETAWRIAYTEAEGDDNTGRLESITRTHPSLGNAVWSVRYDVALSGPAAPHDMSRVATATWGEVDDLPTDATAVFPPKQIPAAVPTTWTRATVHYMDARGKEVNIAAPDGAIASKQYDANGNVQVELTAENRARALASSTPVDTAATLITLHRYASNGVDETETLGPRHQVTLKDGTVVQARTQVLTNHDYGNAPNPSFDYHVVTAKIVAAKLDNGDRRDITTTTFGFDNPDGSHRGWDLRAATKVTTDSGSGHANLTSWTVYDPVLPLVRSKRAPKSTGSGNHDTQYFYFGADSAEPGCSGSGLAGLICKRTTPVGATTAGKPTHTYVYNTYGQQTQHVETIGATTRTTAMAYDADGRPTSTTVTTSPGSDTVSVSRTYSANTGDLVQTTTAAVGSEAARTITRSYDNNGRLASYQDADGEITSYVYDLNGNVAQQSDSKATATYSYDDRDRPISMLDSTLGAATTATYDANGDLATEQLPNGLTKWVTRNASGQAVRQRYEKDGCASDCAWADSTVERDLGGRVVSETAGPRTRSYEYDGAGRLTVAQDDSGSQCTTRVYAYDADSNRTSRRTYASTASGACSQSTTFTTQELSYDEADRINSVGFETDVLGRETQVPSNAIGTQLNATFYANDRAHTLTQGGVTQSYRYDSESRIRERETSGSGVERRHYADDSDIPTWTASGGGWARDIDGLDGATVATRKADGTIAYLLTDLHGDTVAEAEASPVATAPSATHKYDEFGVPAASGARLGWLGAATRTTELDSGVIAMGARSYMPQLGRFLQPDVMAGGAANPYDYAMQDPVNNYDLSGMCGPCILIAIPVGVEIAIAVSAVVTGGVVTAIIITSDDLDFSIPVVNGINWGDPFSFAKGGKNNSGGGHPKWNWTIDQLLEEKKKLNRRDDAAELDLIDEILKYKNQRNAKKRKGKKRKNGNG